MPASFASARKVGVSTTEYTSYHTDIPYGGQGWCGGDSAGRGRVDESFLVLFFKKEPLARAQKQESASF
jgi:hypothetical protein